MRFPAGEARAFTSQAEQPSPDPRVFTPDNDTHAPELLRGEAHPLWAEQVERERGMLMEGADKVRDRVVQARERQQMTRLSPVRDLLQDWLPGVVASLREWVQLCARTRGPKPIALEHLKDADSYVMSLLAVRTILDSVTEERTALAGLAVSIGQVCEHEQMVRLWERKAPEAFWSLQQHFDRTDATAAHRRLANVNRFNAYLRENPDPAFGWTRWRPDVRFRVGLQLITAVVESTRWFEVVADPEHVHRMGKPNSPAHVLVAKPGLLEWLGKSLEEEELRSPAFMPTVIPPKPWSSTRGGGYWTPYVRTPRLIRFKAHQEEQQDRAADEYEALDMPRVYEAVNHLQDVAWRVNGRVLDVALKAYGAASGLAGLPLTTELERPPLPADADTNPEALKDWKRATSDAIRRDLKRLGKVRRVDQILHVAHEYRSCAALYFPHMLDFRGRMYPIPVGLQPQGDDLGRALLTFAEGVPCTAEDEGGWWLAVHLSACWGFDKASYAERVAWVQAREDLWRRIAADPLGNTEWACTEGPGKVDKPWCTLAAIFEWVAYLDHGDGFVSSLPVSVDGTCNGIQHLSAMTRDADAGRHVNLVPANQPQDIYRHVAELLQADLERLEAGSGEHAESARWWLELCGRDLPRGLTKRQVMVLPYGGTRQSFFGCTRKWLDEEGDPLPAGLDYRDEAVKAELSARSQRVVFLANRMWDVVREAVAGGREVMEWLQRTARVTVETGQPLFWETPSGFVVRHFYGQQVSRAVETRIDGRTITMKFAETTDQLDPAAQLRGIAPNFVHSLDAAALALSIVAAKERGIRAFTAVHDAYGTHAGHMWPLFHVLREAFVSVHAIDMLEAFRASCVRVGADRLLAEQPELEPAKAAALMEAKLPPLPARGSLRLGDVLSSDYFFA